MTDEKMKWNADVYNRFRMERMQPSIDLAARAHAQIPGAQKIIDIGCGSGMSTAAVVQHWPGADILGLDLSEEMLEKARALLPQVRFARQDCSLPLDSYGAFDLVFSNAFLQWLDDQEAFAGNVSRIVADGGLLAIQVPNFSAMPANRCIRDAAEKFAVLTEKVGKGRLWNFDAGGYYDLFSRHFARVTVWETDYYHVMDSAEGILSFLSGTALRQYLQFLDPEESARFNELVLHNLRAAYPIRPNGKVLFPFRRVFLLAEGGASC